jgi:3-methyladenine DNA glycosylase/8-oxoguanine DNA glycosylase
MTAPGVRAKKNGTKLKHGAALQVMVYGPNQDTEKLAENWRPYRSVACWYLWRTLGNEQLG